MFLFKKIVGPFFFPVTVILLILLLGFIILALTRKQKTGKILIFLGILLFGGLSYPWIPDRILMPLEYRNSPLLDPSQLSGIRWVVVLGGGHVSVPNLPASSQLSEHSLFRLVEGVRIHRKLPGSRLILSGGGAFDPKSDAAVMADAAVALGIERRDLVLEEASLDTEDQARLIHRIVGRQRFVLVTSASHMPRSLALFRDLGMDPIPAPTDYLVKQREEEGKTGPLRFFPRPDNLLKAEIAVYEYLGLAWARIRGVI